MNVLTCNVRCFGANDGDNGWSHRKALCARVIESQSPDIICFQEMWAEQCADMSSAFPNHATYGMADTPSSRHPQNCIFYRQDLYTLISAGGYWLSETPHVAGSSSWDSACVRLANWVRLEDHVAESEFRVVNTHLDHVSQLAREQQARLIVDDSSAYPTDYPQILTGDMNCDFTNAAIEVFKSGGWLDTYGAAHGTEDPGHTYHGFLGPEHDANIGKMDWIFTRGAAKVIAAELVTDSEKGKFPSDHYFVSADILIQDADDGK